jgi:RNA polymerase sigma-70 factor (ECF subfamily)
MASLRTPARATPDELRRLADEELMQLVARNDPDAFAVLLERHADAAFSLAYRMCGRHAIAEDVTQEAFLAIWRSGARYDSTKGSVRTWVLGIVHHRAVDSLRRNDVHARRRAGEEGLEESLEAAERTEAQAIDNEAARELRGALDELPRDQRRVIELAYFGGFTHVEIASMLEEPIGTVKGRMRLGLKKLRDHLEGWEALPA